MDSTQTAAIVVKVGPRIERRELNSSVNASKVWQNDDEEEYSFSSPSDPYPLCIRIA